MFRIYVGNLNFRTSEQALGDLFAQHGNVANVAIIADRDTGRSRGFAFVEMSDDGEGRAAIEALNGQEIDGRNLTVNEARPRASRGSGGGRRY
jgi:cold-inducible RNA-binding protein